MGPVADTTSVIRPAAVIPEDASARILRELEARDVSAGGHWNATPTMWQRYSGPWDGPAATRGSAQLVGTIAVAYGTPIRDHVTIYRVTVTDAGHEAGWDVESLCDDALQYGGLTLAACPRAEMHTPPASDPFRSS